MASVRHVLTEFTYCAGVQESNWQILLELARGFQKSLLNLKRYVIDPLVDKKDEKDGVQRGMTLVLVSNHMWL